jgi:hypothetical protein
MIDRIEINRALAKACAYQQCGKPRQAAAWAARLVEMLEAHDILTPAARALVAEAR